MLMGANGAGKTTLFDLIAGKTLPDEGRISLDGLDVTKMQERQRACLIGRLFQNPAAGSCPNLTVRENLALAAIKDRQAGFRSGVRAFPAEAADEMLRPLNLDSLLDLPMGALSGGQRQFIAFAMAVLTPPTLLLLDEPTAALDPRSASTLLTFAHQYVKKHAIPTLMITHDVAFANQYGNRLWILKEGDIFE